LQSCANDAPDYERAGSILSAASNEDSGTKPMRARARSDDTHSPKKTLEYFADALVPSVDFDSDDDEYKNLLSCGVVTNH